MTRAAWLEPVPGRCRRGLKGPRAGELLASLGLTLPDLPNSWAPLRTHEADAATDVLARLGYGEFFLEEAEPAPISTALDARQEPGVYPVLREDAAFCLGGPRAAQVLAEVCNVDFHTLPAGRPLYLTLMIGVAVLVLPQVRADGRIFRIWCDPSFGPYLQETLEAVVHRIQSGSST